MINFTRKALVRAAGIALLTSTVLIHLSAPTTHAAPAASQSYRTSSYSLRYPSDWSEINSGSSNTFTIFTDDRNAFVTVTVQPASNLDGSVMPQAFTNVLGQSGTVVEQPHYGASSLHGVRVYWASGVVRYENNAHVGVLNVYLATYHSHTYLAAMGVVDTGDDAYSIGSQEYQEGQQILNTLSFR